MALVILHKHTDCDYCNNIGCLDISFPEEETVAKSKFDTKGITLFYIFIGLIMFALLNQQHLYLNIIGFVLAILVALRLFNVEKKFHPHSYQ